MFDRPALPFFHPVTLIATCFGSGLVRFAPAGARPEIGAGYEGYDTVIACTTHQALAVTST